MNKEQLVRLFDKLSVAARLSDVGLFMSDGEAIRSHRVITVLEKLDPGVYLLGSGPYTQGVYSLMCDEVVVGRLASVLEASLDKPVDVFVNDAANLTPREVSRVHCSIYRRRGVVNHDYWLIDKGSTCGTFLNEQQLEVAKSDDENEVRRVSRALSNGDVISLGPYFCEHVFICGSEELGHVLYKMWNKESRRLCKLLQLWPKPFYCTQPHAKE